MNRTSTLHRLRTAGIGLCLGGVAVSAWSSAISVRAANTGDIFIQNVEAGAPSGHDNDPKLSCTDIDLWGSGLVLSTSTFTIAGSPPSGSQETVYSASWTYSSAVADPQIIAVVPVATLIADAAAAGDTPQAGNGYHFKIDFAQDSGKSKTFWIDCPAPTGDPGTGSTGSGGGTTTTTSSSSSSTDAGTTTSSDSSSTTTSTDAGTTTSSDSSTTTTSTDAGTTTSGSSSTTTTDAGTTTTGSSSTSTDAAPLVQDGSTTTSTSTSTQSSSAGTSGVDGTSGENGLSNGSATIGSLGSGATTSSSSTTTQSAPQTSTTASTTSSAAGGNIGVSITAPAPTAAPAPVPTSAPLLPTAASEPPAPNTGADIPFGLGLLLLIGGAGTILVSSALRRRRA